jgi:hypothetical protein
MPSISDAIKSASNLEASGYVGSDPVNNAGSPPVSNNYDPGRNAMIRCPVPSLWQDSSDSQRQFFMDGAVPQNRIMTPNPTAPNGSLGTAAPSGGGNTGIIITGGGGGGGSTSSGTLAAVQAVVTTQVLPPGAKFAGNIAVTKSFQLLSIAVSSPARVQFYGTASAQSADMGRGLDVPPPAGVMQNIIADVVLDTSPLLWSFQNRMGANADQPQQSVMYVTITNLDAISDPVTLTLQYVPLENTQ